MRTNTETTLSAKELLLQAQKFNLRSNEDIFDKESWIFMFFLPKTEEDIGVLNKLFYACRSNILPPPFSNDNIDNLILLCTKPHGKTSSVARLLKEADMDITKVTQEEMMGVILKASLAPQTYEKAINGELNVEELLKGDESQELSEEEKAAEDASLANFDNSNDYDKVTCRTLVIGAEYDGINPPELGREVADGIKDAEFELIKDAGHLVIVEQPDEFKNIVNNFLNQ